MNQELYEKENYFFENEKDEADFMKYKNILTENYQIETDDNHIINIYDNSNMIQKENVLKIIYPFMKKKDKYKKKYTKRNLILRSKSIRKMSDVSSIDDCFYEKTEENTNSLKQNSNDFLTVTNVANNSNSLKKKKLNYEEVEEIVNKKYLYNVSNKYSNELNIIITYLRGQKTLFIHSKNFFEFYYYFINFFIVLISISMTVSSVFLYEYTWGYFIVIGANTIISVLIPILNYIKLETAIERYSFLCFQYQELETSLEFACNKLYFIKNEETKTEIILSKLDTIENKLQEIREYNSILVPQKIEYLFPIISNINIFHFIKKVENHKEELITRLMDVKNEINYIHSKFKKLTKFNKNKFSLIFDDGKKMNSSDEDNSSGTDSTLNEDENVMNENESSAIMVIKKELHNLVKIKDDLVKELISFNNSYKIIDEIFGKEIKRSMKYNNYLFIVLSSCCFYNIGINIEKYADNKIVYETLKNIL